MATSPSNLTAAQNAPDAHLWEQSWNSEIDGLEARGAIRYIPRHDLPPNTALIPLKVTLRLKRDENGNP